MRIIGAVLDFIGRTLSGYEPVVAAQVVAATFTAAAGLGIAVGDWPQKVDAVLTFAAVVVPLLAGVYARSKVTPEKTLREA